MFRERNLLVMMGQDYAYENAGQNYKKMDSMIKYIESNYKDLNMEFKYSTPSDYMMAVKEEKLKYPTYTNDLFPYTEGDNEVWSGFFSSRPGLKKQVKDTSALLHSHNKVFAQQVLKSNVKDAEVTDILKAKDQQRRFLLVRFSAQ